MPFTVILIINRWAWALVPQGWWSRATHSRKGGTHGNLEAATTYLGTVPLKDTVEYLPDHKETLRPTHGRLGWENLWSLQANVLAKWALWLIASNKQHVGVTRSPCKEPGLPQASCIQRKHATAYRHHKVSLQTTKAACKKAACKIPASKGRCRALLHG